jgi:hypothetical protein
MNAESYIGRLQEYQRRVLTAGAAVLLILPFSAQGGGVVTTCTEAALRAAMAGGGTVTFACEGTLTLASAITNDANVVLDASGHRVTISGGGSVPVFTVNAGATLTLLGLTVANGGAAVGGGAVCNLGGTLNATNCTFCDNRAQGLSPDDGLPAFGGAIYNSGVFNASQCSFLRNQASGGAGADGVDGSPFRSPGSGHAGGSAYGGAVYNGGTMVLERSLFASNSVAGGAGGRGGDGSWQAFYPCPGQDGGSGAGGGMGLGGDICQAGTASLVNCTFASNRGVGGAGGRGGNAGLINWNPHSATGCAGGSGASGGSGSGSIYQRSGYLTLSNCTVAFNLAAAGAGGAGGYGSLGYGNGAAASNGSAWGGMTCTGSILCNTLLATNLPGGNLTGSVVDAGHNLSSDGSCAFTNAGSLNSTDPRIGPLADNGGPTLTVALLPGSPAIDAADPAAAPPTDQRGISRPVGPAPDIGAFEYGLPAVLRVSGSPAAGLDFAVSAYPGLSCRLLSSSNFTAWVPVATNSIPGTGTLLLHQDCAPGAPCWFYRAVTP